MATVDTISTAFQLQRMDMQLAHDLMGGTKAMARAGERYIPKGKSETPEEYHSRIQRTVLLNAYKRTVRFCRGQVFKKNVVVEDRKPEDLLTQEQVEWFKHWAEDVNHNSDSLTEWSGGVFEAGLNDGVTFALVDYSAVVLATDAAGRPMYQDAAGQYRFKTAEADRENGWGPYVIHVPAGQVIECRAEVRNGVQRVSHFRYMENFDVVKDAWSTERRQRIRVFEPGTWQTWENTADGSGAFVLTDSGEMKDENGAPLTFVPVVIFMPGERRTAVTAEPALQDLAELNKRHWQATSDQAEMMEFARRPVWFGRQLGEMDPVTGKDKEIEFGAGRLINASSEYASLVSLGIDAASVTAGRQELQDLEGQMALYGLQLLQPNSGASVVTATEVAQDTEETLSALQDWALRFQDFLENILRTVAMWRGEADGPSVKVNSDFSKMLDVEYLLRLQEGNVISKQTLLGLLVNAGILPDDFDVDGEADRIAQELNAQGGPSGTLNLADILNRGRGQNAPNEI